MTAPIQKHWMVPAAPRVHSRPSLLTLALPAPWGVVAPEGSVHTPALQLTTDVVGPTGRAGAGGAGGAGMRGGGTGDGNGGGVAAGGCGRVEGGTVSCLMGG